MYPKLVIDLKKLKNNLEAVAKITTDQGNCSLMIVTKGLCADKEMVKLVAGHPTVRYMADSRVKNLESYADFVREQGKKTVLLRLPMPSEIEKVVTYADISFNSEISTIRLLNEEAAKQGKRHKIVLMIDLGDLREGIFFENHELICSTMDEIMKMEHIELYGLGANLTCYGAIIPKKENLSILTGLASEIEQKYDIRLNMISGGNSSSIYLIEKGELPKGINNLRLGEAFLLGNDTAYGQKLPGTTGDAIVLEAQIIELQQKPSLPIGEVGVDAFGQKPYYEDRGIIKRAIIAIGKQDTDTDSMVSLDKKMEILGASSDHLIVDVTNSNTTYKVGDIVRFEIGYGGMLKLATSPYVEKHYLT
ncbi:ornithine racemase Orr [Clostridium aminobutyricum]|uniref:Alanine/ornithine racemase family PLP-dependent enzyme n=1 Tax=Clostridium aminobutyricum TaxID=33953 RepID=A0A939D9L5_CLOAM|nr:ornithine racemase Orr [Clostridium aminobutyricum]MBN7773288.1 alanine/ornithine racemase family PLP-dependent enzyme [Clostridium aminobutyricum]